MTETTYNKPIPVPDKASRPFFEGARRHELMLQRCNGCGAHLWPVKSRCDACWSDDVAWVRASGRGVLYSFTLVHQVYHPGFAGEIPYNIAMVELEEGLRMIANVIGVPNSELRIGMPLEVTFDDLTDEVSLPRFQPRQ